MAVVTMTGASGLIGRHVVAQLDPTDDLVRVTHSETDLLDPGAFVAVIKQVDPKSVLHLAWSASRDPGYRSSPNNQRWQAVTFEAANYCAQAGIAFVCVGSAVDDLTPVDAYASSKQELRRSLAPLLDAGSVTLVRPFYVFDPEARRPGVLAELITARDEGRPARLQQPGALHDFVHVHDVAVGIAHVLRQQLRGLVDIGSGQLRSVADLAAAAGCDWVHDETAREDLAHADRAADISRLRAAGWAPTRTMRFFGDD